MYSDAFPAVSPYAAGKLKFLFFEGKDKQTKAIPSILNRTRVISSPYMQRAACCSVGEKLKEKMGHKLMFGSHFSYEYGQL